MSSDTQSPGIGGGIVTEKVILRCIMLIFEVSYFLIGASWWLNLPQWSVTLAGHSVHRASKSCSLFLCRPYFQTDFGPRFIHCFFSTSKKLQCINQILNAPRFAAHCVCLLFGGERIACSGCRERFTENRCTMRLKTTWRENQNNKLQDGKSEHRTERCLNAPSSWLSRHYDILR